MKSEVSIKLSVIIPVYNERDNIEKVIAAALAVDVDKELIVVDDCSTDGTREYLQKIKTVRVVLHGRNLGKGAAIRSGLQLAEGDIVVIQDADLEYSPAEYPKLMAPITSGAARVVYGSRILGRGSFLRRSYYANRFLTLLTNLLYKGRLTDMETCYKLVESKLMLDLNLTSSRFEIEPEITCKILKRKEKFIEVPITYRGRTKGKKIGPKDGIQAIWNILKWKIRK